jgi:hypothetical protein
LEAKVFYSKSANLNVQVQAPMPRVDNITGQRVLEGGKMAQFQETGESYVEDGTGKRCSIGYYRTDDPEVIERLSNHPLVLRDGEYNRVMTPPEIREKIASQENQRLISQNNELLARLQKLEGQKPAK